MPAEYRYIYTVYSGGASFLFELRALMGEEDFRAFLQEFYSSNLNSEVTTGQFLEAAFKRIGNDKAKDLFKKYFSQENIPEG